MVPTFTPEPFDGLPVLSTYLGHFDPTATYWYF